jgi:putative thiamine transport system substrate-binding protein
LRVSDGLLLAPLCRRQLAAIQQQAKGQTVWFNAWGGDPAVNRYLEWVSGEMQTHYAITLKIVPLADAADAVKRIQTEAAAGRKANGSVDLLWVNGENFRTLKEANLLQTGWAQTLPNWRYVDTRKPVTEDFAIPTDGAESPWGGAQLTFIARKASMPTPPVDPQALLAYAQQHPGKISYPRPPDFTGTAFLEQLLLTLTAHPEALQKRPMHLCRGYGPALGYLDTLHPLLWREGKISPSPARMDALLASGSLNLSLTFNPAHAQQKVASGELPADSYSFGFQSGMLGNVHFVAIPANASASAGESGRQFPAVTAGADPQGRPGHLGRPERAGCENAARRRSQTAAGPYASGAAEGACRAAVRLGERAGAGMAASLRHPLSGLVWLAMAVIYLPILPAGAMLLAPAFSATNWQRLLNDPQLPQAPSPRWSQRSSPRWGRC